MQVTVEKPDRLALMNLCVCYAIMINSKLAKQHATAEDPWAQDWMKANTAGGGAYIVESFKPGEQLVLRRNENWKAAPDGALPFFRRIIIQTVPEAATRANLIERGDADLSIDLAASDIPASSSGARRRWSRSRRPTASRIIAMNTQMAPFDNAQGAPGDRRGAAL